MQTLTRLPYDSGPDFFIFVSLLFLFSAWIEFRRKGAFVARLVAGLLLVALVFTPFRPSLPVSFWLFLLPAVFAIDVLFDKRYVLKTRQKYAVLLVCIAVFSGFLMWRPFSTRRIITITNEALTFEYRDVKEGVNRANLRIIEFDEPPDREWHMKDGVAVLTISEWERYKDSKGDVITARQVIERIEKWAGVQRVNKPKPAH